MSRTASHRSPRTTGSRRSAGTRLAASVALVAGAAAVAGLGTYGSFTSSTTANETVAAGEVKLAMAGQAQGFDVAATGLVPGDTVQRAVRLTRAGSTEGFGSVSLTTSGGGLLATDPQGLRIAVEQCTVPWSKVAGSMALSCGGTSSVVLAQRPVTVTGQPLAATTTALNGAGAAANLKVTLSLPTEAGNNLQGATGTIALTFDATQRGGQAR